MSIDSTFEHRYSKDIHHTSVAILGIYPPPYGGVSVHIQRVMDLFAKQHNKVHLFNTEDVLRSEWTLVYLIKFFLFLIRTRSAIVFYHSSYLTSSILDLLIIAAVKRMVRYRIIIVEHDCRHILKRSRWFKKLYQWVLDRAEKIVFIGDSTYKSYQSADIRIHEYSIEGAFIPPTMHNAALISQQYPSSLFNFLREYTPIIMVNASQLMVIEGNDIYGIDQCIEMIAGLKKDYPDVGLLVVLAQVGNELHFKVLQEQMKAHGVTEHVYILHNKYELWPLFQYVDIFVRPSLSDGASVSVQEALHCGVPTIASDVCKRPEGAIVFGMGNHNAFTQSVRDALNSCIYSGNASTEKRGRVFSG